MQTESTRQRKFAREIQRELSVILQQELDAATGAMITLSHVSASPDLGHVRAYITTFPDDKLPLVLRILTDENVKIRTLLARKIRNSVKSMPTLAFYEDETLKTAKRLDQIFSEIKREEPGE